MSERYVIDANVLFSAFISGKEVYQLLSSEHVLYVPDIAFLEIERYRERILKKTKLDREELQRFALKLLQKLTVVPSLLLSQPSLKHAHEACEDIDEKDTMYLAVAIELGVTLITGDRALHDGLRERGFRNVVLLRELIGRLPPAQ